MYYTSMKGDFFMVSDVGNPLINIGKSSRDETLIVYFNGFIKNPVEGIIRTMLRDDDVWMPEYPFLETFQKYDSDELYENTLLLDPVDILKFMSNNKKDDNEISEDLKKIYPSIILENSKITTFEYSLFQILKENFVKKCIFYKDDEFYPNELQYIERNYHNMIDKVEFAEGGFIDLFTQVNPTTIFTSDKEMVMSTLRYNYKDKIENCFFVLLNDLHNVVFNEEKTLFEYAPAFQAAVEDINLHENFLVSSMYNFALSSNEMDEEFMNAFNRNEPISEESDEAEDNEEERDEM